MLLVMVLALFALEGKALVPTDTLSPESWNTCPEEPVFWVNPGTGPIFGNNLLGDLEKAQLLSLPAPGNGFVTHALVYWAFKRSDENGRLRVRAWNVAGDGSPGSVIGNSSMLRVDDVDTVMGWNLFSFSEPTAFTHSVFLSLDLSNMENGDSIAVLATVEECGLGCLSWERWSDGSWNPICDTYNLEAVDMFIRAVVEWTPWPAGLETPARPWSVEPPFPQPLSRSTHTTLSVMLNSIEPTALQMDLFDSAAKRIIPGRELEIAAGSQRIDIMLPELKPGSYTLILNNSSGGLSWPILVLP